MKKYAAAILVAFVLSHAPYRVMGLLVTTLMVTPSHIHLPQGNAAYWKVQSLEARMQALGWTVVYQTNPHMGFAGAYGLTVGQSHIIWIDPHLSWDGRYNVLAHEAGHVMAPGWVNPDQNEIFAEVVAALVVRDSWWTHARYLSRYNRGEFLLMAVLNWPSMYRAAAVLNDR